MKAFLYDVFHTSFSINPRISLDRKKKNENCSFEILRLLGRKSAKKNLPLHSWKLDPQHFLLKTITIFQIYKNRISRELWKYNNAYPSNKRFVLSAWVAFSCRNNQCNLSNYLNGKYAFAWFIHRPSLKATMKIWNVLNCNFH